MASGMEMMLKSMLGIGPEEIEQFKNQIESLRVAVPEAMDKANARITNIETMLVAIVANQQSLYRSLVQANVIAPISETPLINMDGPDDAKPN